MKEMWDKRYKDEVYAYGTEPNLYLKENLKKFNVKGKILFPAEGEGRNAVYAAKQGLDVYAFDTSIEGKKKAFNLAKIENVNINYEVGNFFDLKLIKEKFDATGLIFSHFPPNILINYHKKISELIKPNGIIIFMGFSTEHAEYRKNNPAIGGPQDLDMLFSEESIKRDFADFVILELKEEEIELNEGLYHNGLGRVIKFVGRKR